MRRSDREVTDKAEILAIMKACDVCRLAFNDTETGFPYILPLNFGFVEENDVITLFFHGANQGYKYEVIARDPRASFEMDCKHQLQSWSDKGYCTMSYMSIIGQGVVEIIEDRNAKIEALTILTDNYHKEHFPFNEAAVDRTTLMKLKVDRLTAKYKKAK